MAQVKLEGVRKVYGEGPGAHVAVHGVDLEVRDGEFVVLVGPSGCGKSTTLRMIAGLESLSGGTLRIGDRVVNDLPPKDRDIAMVFQNYALYPHMTVYDNMAFALTLRKMPRREIDERVRQAADILNLGAILERRPKALSGGQRQRVAIGRAIVRHPQVFLFDEPLSNLDAKLRVQMRREIARLHRELRTTIVYVTHDQVEAMTLGDRIVVMSEGRVQQVGAPLELYDRPANRFVAGFIGSPAMNFLDGTVRRDGARLVAAIGDLFTLPPPDSPRLAALDGRAVTVGIRPEDVHVAGGRAGSALAAGAPSASFRTELVEPLGNEILLYARAGDRELTARVPPQTLPAVGQPVTLALDPAKVHLFDAASGESLNAMGSDTIARTSDGV